MIAFGSDERKPCGRYSIFSRAIYFRVPLSTAALAVIDEARRQARGGFLFPNVRRGVISDMTMGKYMARLKMEYRPHGFRSSLRDWIEEATKTPYEVAEMTLGHSVGGSVERAYRRTDYLDQRRKVVEAWGIFLSNGG